MHITTQTLGNESLNGTYIFILSLLKMHSLYNLSDGQFTSDIRLIVTITFLPFGLLVLTL